MISPEDVEFKKSARAKTVRITVRSNGTVLVTAPKYAPMHLVRSFFREKAQWVEEQLTLIRKNPAFQNAAPARRVNAKRDYLVHKEAARKLVHAKLKQFNAFYKFDFGNVAIRNQKTRWGSCSKNKNLNFNYKIVKLAPEQQDYIIVHELCHLKEFNHGPAFWGLVALTIPDYKKIRKTIKTFTV